MALERQNVPVIFTGGIDTKSDPKQIQGKLLKLQNGVFTSPGEIRKRNGHDALGINLTGGGVISSGLGIATYNSELLQMDGVNLYSYTSALNEWTTKGALTGVNVTSQSVVNNSYNQIAPDSGIIATLRLFAWEDQGRPGVRYSIQDTVSGEFIIQDASLSSNNQAPKVLVMGTVWVVVVSGGGAGTISYYGVDSVTFTVTNYTLGSNLNTTNSNYDACIYPGGNLFIAWNNSTGGHTVVHTATVGGSLTTVTTASEPAGGCICIFPDVAHTKIAVIYASSTTLHAHTYNPTTGASLASATTVDTASVNFTQVTGGAGPEVFSCLGSVPRLRQATGLAGSYSSWITSDHLRSVSLAGKLFQYNSVTYVPIQYVSTLQSGYYLVDGAKNIVAKAFSGNGGAALTRNILPESVSAASGVFSLPVSIVTELTTQPGTTSTATGVGAPTFTLQGLANIIFNFTDPVNLYLSEALGNNLHAGGGFLWMYDGFGPVEHGFHIYPEGCTSQVLPFGGALGVPAGVSTTAWDYATCYEWTDNEAQVHRSAPSVPNRAALGVSATGPTFGFVDNGNGTVLGSITASNLATSFSYASAFSFIAKVTNTSTAITNINAQAPGFANTPGDYILPGASITGVDIPADTHIVAIAASSVTMDQAATSTQANELITINNQYGFLGLPTGNTVALSQVNLLWFCGVTVSSSPVIQVGSTANLAVGQTIQSCGAHISGKIISVGASSITLDTNASSSTQGYVLLSSFYLLSGTPATTSGSPNITGVSAADVAYAAARVGQQLDDGGTDITAGTTILSASGTTIVMSANAIGTGNPTVSIFFTGDVNLRVGNVLTGGVARAYQPNTEIVALASGVATLNANVTLTFASPGQFYTANLASVLNVIPTLRLTAKQGLRTPVSLVTYRTPGNQTVFYRDSSVSAPLYNDTTVDSLSYQDSIQDVNLIVAPTLYTTGGVLENIEPGAVSSLAVYKNRIVALDSQNPLKLWYSKQTVSGSPVEFSDFLTLHADPIGGDVTAVASMDDKLVIFKRTDIFVMTGTGPDSTGAQNDFSPMQLIASDCGCINARSIMLTPMGLMFQSLKGFQLLDRSLGVQYIGAEVEAFNGQTVTSAELIADANQVRIGFNSDEAIVYDYYMKQWATFTAHSQVAAVVWNDVYTFLLSNGVVWTETSGEFSDAGAVIPLALTTTWLQMAGVQGYQRTRRMLVLGEWESSHILTVGVSYDFDDTTVQTDTVDMTFAQVPYQQLIHFANQKCEAIQISLSDSSDSPGESLRLSGLTFEVAVKRGLKKLSATNQSG